MKSVKCLGQTHQKYGADDYDLWGKRECFLCPAVLEECEWERVGRQKAKVRGLEMEDDEGRRGSQEGLILISIPTTELAPYFFNCQKNPSLRDRIAAKRR